MPEPERAGILAGLRSGTAQVGGEITRRMAAAGVFVDVAAEVHREIATARTALAPWSAHAASGMLLELATYLEGQLNGLPLLP